LLKSLSISQIQFTLDGDEELHNTLRIHKNGEGTFKQILAAIRLSTEVGFSTFVRINLNPLTTPRIEHLLRIFTENGIGPHNITLYFNEMKNHGNADMRSDIYFPTLSKFGDALIDCLIVLKQYGYPIPRFAPIDVNCEFDKPSSVFFGPDGNIYHCTTGTNKALAKLGSNGRLMNETLRRSFVHNRKPWDDPGCRNCNFLPVCMGGCSYLDDMGKMKCNPDMFILESLVRLSLN
jgi:uncharacterized protein